MLQSRQCVAGTPSSGYDDTTTNINGCCCFVGDALRSTDRGRHTNSFAGTTAKKVEGKAARAECAALFPSEHRRLIPSRVRPHTCITQDCRPSSSAAAAMVIVVNRSIPEVASDVTAAVLQ
jgi:hypothetical protein